MQRLRAIALLLSVAFARAAQAEPLILEKQGSFFVGGRAVHSDMLSTQEGWPPSGTVTVDQVYVRYQVPVNAGEHNVVLIHGCCATGKSWETTPDGRMGWDEYFVRRGFPTYVIDQAHRGRSAADISLINAVRTGKATVDQLPPVYAGGHEAVWQVLRFGPEYPKPFPGVLFPLQAQEEFWKQVVPDWIDYSVDTTPTAPALSELAGRLGNAILISHSQSGSFPLEAAAINARGIAGVIAIEPGYCLEANVDMNPFMKIPVLVLFGDFVDQSTRWAPRLKDCRKFVRAAVKAGVKAELVVLPEIGIKGNSHMIMQDRNSLQVADLLLDWIRDHVSNKPRH